LLLTTTAVAQPNQAVPAGAVAFDIPAQPLAVSLASFGAATRISVLVSSDLTAGRKSTALRGSFTPKDALGRILSETGLVPQVLGPDAITLVEAPPVPVRKPPPFVQYATAIQTGVMTALCGRNETKPLYRIVIRLWLDPAGMVTHVELATTSGNPGRDAAIVATLQKVDIGAPPPPDMPRLVKLVVLPRPGGDTGCAPNYLGGRSHETTDEQQ
jgi:TonB family protein